MPKVTGRVCPNCGGKKTYYAAQCRRCAGDNRIVPAARYGRLTVVEEGPAERTGLRTLIVRCDCGVEKIVRLSHLTGGRVISCGCAPKEKNTKHGEAPRVGRRTPEYDAWLSLVQRCTNPKNPRWKDYGGRGISVCAEWRDNYASFLAHVGRRPSAHHSIDRMNNDGNYEPGNVRWATPSQQQQNRRRSR